VAAPNLPLIENTVVIALSIGTSSIYGGVLLD